MSSNRSVVNGITFEDITSIILQLKNEVHAERAASSVFFPFSSSEAFALKLQNMTGFLFAQVNMDGLRPFGENDELPYDFLPYNNAVDALTKMIIQDILFTKTQINDVSTRLSRADFWLKVANKSKEMDSYIAFSSIVNALVFVTAGANPIEFPLEQNKLFTKMMQIVIRGDKELDAYWQVLKKKCVLPDLAWICKRLDTINSTLYATHISIKKECKDQLVQRELHKQKASEDAKEAKQRHITALNDIKTKYAEFLSLQESKRPIIALLTKGKNNELMACYEEAKQESLLLVSSSSAPVIHTPLNNPSQLFVRRAKTSGRLDYQEGAAVAGSSSPSKPRKKKKFKEAQSNESLQSTAPLLEAHSASSLPSELNPLGEASPIRRRKTSKTKAQLNGKEELTPPRRSKSAVDRRSKLTASSEMPVADIQSSSSPSAESVLRSISPTITKRPRKSSEPDKPEVVKKTKKKKMERSVSSLNVSLGSSRLPSLNLNPVPVEVSNVPQALASPLVFAVPDSSANGSKNLSPNYPKRNRGFVAAQKRKIENASQKPQASSSAESTSPRGALIAERINELVRQGKIQAQKKQEAASARTRSNTLMQATLFAKKPTAPHVRRTSSEASLRKQGAGKK